MVKTATFRTGVVPSTAGYTALKQDFDDLMTVHLSIILASNQLKAQIIVL